MLWRSRCTHDLYNVEGVNGWESDSSPLLRNLQQGVHKRGKYSSQYIRTCIVFKLERFQCLNFPALPIFQTLSWIYLAFVFQFTSLHDYQNMCVCLFLKLFFFPLHYKCFQKKSWFFVLASPWYFSWLLFSSHPHLSMFLNFLCFPLIIQMIIRLQHEKHC